MFDCHKLSLSLSLNLLWQEKKCRAQFCIICTEQSVTYLVTALGWWYRARRQGYVLFWFFRARKVQNSNILAGKQFFSLSRCNNKSSALIFCISYFDQDPSSAPAWLLLESEELTCWKFVDGRFSRFDLTIFANFIHGKERTVKLHPQTYKWKVSVNSTQHTQIQGTSICTYRHTVKDAAHSAQGQESRLMTSKFWDETLNNRKMKRYKQEKTLHIVHQPNLLAKRQLRKA